MSLSAELKQTPRHGDMESRLAVAKGGAGGSGMDGEFGISRCKLLHLDEKAMRSNSIAEGTISNLPG